jgi:hypothetical protein
MTMNIDDVLEEIRMQEFTRKINEDFFKGDHCCYCGQDWNFHNQNPLMHEFTLRGK